LRPAGTSFVCEGLSPAARRVDKSGVRKPLVITAISIAALVAIAVAAFAIGRGASPKTVKLVAVAAPTSTTVRVTTTTRRPKPVLPPTTRVPVTLPPVTVPSVTVPPVTFPPATFPPATFPPVTSPPPTAAPVVCPTGSPVVQVTAVYHHPDALGAPVVDYSASGTITNHGTGPIVPGVVFVDFNDAKGGLMSYLEMFWPSDAAGHDLTPTIPSGATVPWDARWSGPGLDFASLMGPPAAVVAKLSGWYWAFPFGACLALGGT
jgi:hypothetical protein